MSSARLRHERLAETWGLTGMWTPVARQGILNRTIRILPGYYFLIWETLGPEQHMDKAILWEEGQQGPDSRIPPACFWLGAWYSPAVLGTEMYAFRGGQEFPHREALLRQVGFHQAEGPFGFMELAETPVPWEW